MGGKKKKKSNDDDSGSDEGDDNNPFAEKTANFTYKIILVGSAEVGKTSITNRYVADTFSDMEKHSREVKIHHKVVDIPSSVPPQTAELHIWDTLG